MWSGRSSRDRSPTRTPGERFRDSSMSCACPVCQPTRCRSSVCRTAGAPRGLPRHRDRLEVPEDVAREARGRLVVAALEGGPGLLQRLADFAHVPSDVARPLRSEEHTSELQSQSNLVCRLLLEKKKKKRFYICDID